MDVPEATTPPVSSGVRFLGIARGKLRQKKRGSVLFFLNHRFFMLNLLARSDLEKL
jgi:hypothetical protein